MSTDQQIRVGGKISCVRESSSWSSSGSTRSMQQVVEWSWNMVVRKLEEWLEEERRPLMEEGVECLVNSLWEEVDRKERNRKL